MGRWSGHVNQLKSVLGKDLCHSLYGTFCTVNSYRSLLKMRPEIIKISAKGKKHINNIFSFILCWLLGGPVTVSSGKNEEMGRTQSGKCRGSFWHGQRYFLTMFIPCFLHNSSLSPHCMRGSFASTWHHSPCTLESAPEPWHLSTFQRTTGTRLCAFGRLQGKASGIYYHTTQKVTFNCIR